MSTKVRITMEVDDEYADPDHEMGLTEEAYLQLSSVLGEFGEDIDIKRVVG